MKKIMAVTIVLCLFAFILSGCGQRNTEPVFYAENGAFNCSPQELIDYLNDAAEEADCYTIPDYINDEEEIEINSVTMTMNFRCDGGNVQKMELYWGDYEENMFASGVYCGALLTALFPEDSNRINNEMSKIIQSSGGEFDEVINGIHINFWVFGTAGHRLILTAE